jgi:hypothetical protein
MTIGREKPFHSGGVPSKFIRLNRNRNMLQFSQDSTEFLLPEKAVLPNSFLRDRESQFRVLAELRN